MWRLVALIRHQVPKFAGTAFSEVTSHVCT
jgi:hypothetical protein